MGTRDCPSAGDSLLPTITQPQTGDTPDIADGELQVEFEMNSNSAAPRFQIVRPHAKGGLGQVSVALDRELHREVALKEIQERFADDPE